jgi:hypothetical protein
MAASCATASGHTEDDRNVLLRSVPKLTSDACVGSWRAYNLCPCDRRIDATETLPDETERSPHGLDSLSRKCQINVIHS